MTQNKYLIYPTLLLALMLIQPASISAARLSDGKEAKKECKKLIKKLKEEGWKVFAVQQTLESALYEPFLRMGHDDDIKVIEGNGTSKSENAAVRKAMNDARMKIAQYANSTVRGNTTMTSETETDGTQNECVDVLYRMSSQHNVKVESRDIVLIRETVNGIEAKVLLFTK